MHGFYTWGVSGCPYICMPHTFLCPHTFICLPGVYTPPYVPHTPVHLYVIRGSQRLLHVVGGCKGSHYVLGHFPYTTPVCGCLPSVAPPHLVVGFPMHWYVSGISMSCGHFSLLLGVWGSPISWGFWGHISTYVVHMLILVHFFSALCLTFLLLHLWLLLCQLWWCLLACHQWQWLPPLQSFQ